MVKLVSDSNFKNLFQNKSVSLYGKPNNPVETRSDPIRSEKQVKEVL